MYLYKGNRWGKNPQDALAFLDEVRARDHCIYRRLKNYAVVVVDTSTPPRADALSAKALETPIEPEQMKRNNIPSVTGPTKQPSIPAKLKPAEPAPVAKLAPSAPPLRAKTAAPATPVVQAVKAPAPVKAAPAPAPVPAAPLRVEAAKPKPAPQPTPVVAPAAKLPPPVTPAAPVIQAVKAPAPVKAAPAPAPALRSEAAAAKPAPQPTPVVAPAAKPTPPAAPEVPVFRSVETVAPAKVAPAQTVTSVQARIDVGFGNALFIRGEGSGLSWNKGVLMQCAEPATWVWSSTNSHSPVVFKLLLNDQVWTAGENLTLQPGQRAEIVPAF